MIPSVEERRKRDCIDCVFTDPFCEFLTTCGIGEEKCPYNFTAEELKELIDFESDMTGIHC